MLDLFSIPYSKKFEQSFNFQDLFGLKGAKMLTDDFHVLLGVPASLLLFKMDSFRKNCKHVRWFQVVQSFIKYPIKRGLKVDLSGQSLPPPTQGDMENKKRNNGVGVGWGDWNILA